MNEAEVLKVIPEINLICDPDLRAKSIDCWKQALEMGAWDKKGVANCPIGAELVADDCPETSIDHCRRVVRMCQAAWDCIGDWAQDMVGADHDKLLCAAVLHDIGKFLEYDRVDGKACHTELGEKIRHPAIGAYIAQVNHIPQDIVFMILAHSDGLSPERGENYPMPELMMLKKLDHMCYMIAEMGYPINK